VATIPRNLLTTVSPHEDLDILVEVEGSCANLSTQCRSNLLQLGKQGIRTTVANFLARSATMYIQRSSVNCESVDQNELNLAYALLSFASPRTVDHKGKRRLVINQTINSRLQAIITETMAIGAGLLAAEATLNVPLQYWYPTERLHRLDFEASHKGSKYGLEAKGRIDKNNLSAAKKSIHDKMNDLNIKNQFNHIIGSVYIPSLDENGTPRINPYDIVIIDPENDVPMQSRYSMQRSLLKHYSYLYKAQGYYDMYERMSQLSDENNEGLLIDYLNTGMRNLAPGRNWRITFRVRDVEYVGTAWQDRLGMLAYEGERNKDGAYMWGIKRSLHDAIVMGNISALMEMHEEDDFWQEIYRYITLGDGSAIGWAPSIDLLLRMS